MESKIIQTSALRRYILLILLTLLGYLIEVCVIPYVRFDQVCANFLWVIISIVVVAYGKLRAFWIGCIYGILMEIMLPSVSMFNLALYPLITLFCSFGFADKSQQRLEYERTLSREKKGSSPLLRTVGCSIVTTMVYDIFNVIYIYINGTAIARIHIKRALIEILLTGLITLAIMFPVRRLIFGKWDKPQRPAFLRRKKLKSVV